MLQILQIFKYCTNFQMCDLVLTSMPRKLRFLCTSQPQKALLSSNKAFKHKYSTRKKK